MGIKFYCPSCDKRLNVKSFLAGKSGFCPHCQSRLHIPAESEPKRAKTIDPGASTILKQESRLPETAREKPAADHSSGNGHAKGQAAPVRPHAVPTPQGPPGPSSTPAPAAQPSPAQPGGAPPMGHSSPGGHPAYGPAPVHPATAAPTVPAAPAAPAAPEAPDPIAESPHAVWYVRPPAGGQYGPAAGDVMRKWLGEGRVSADSLVWREGWPDWRKAARVFPSLAAASAPAATSPAASGSAPGAASPSLRALRGPRRRDSNTFAVTAIIVLVLASIGLLAGLLWVLGVIG
ncbi:MAG: DUF4339 domain-containing protein [Planctomycetes bacterium]|nr:DUF4339 domain-containing protein [Planctomycetota bacterium]